MDGMLQPRIGQMVTKDSSKLTLKYKRGILNIMQWTPTSCIIPIWSATQLNPAGAWLQASTNSWPNHYGIWAWELNSATLESIKYDKEQAEHQLPFQM